MKKATFILFIGIAVAAVAAVNPISWKTTSVNLGPVKAGETKTLSFEFTNDSDQPVTILEAKGSCGCTNVKHPTAAIAPGGTAAVSAQFTSKSVGAFKKNIRIKTSGSEEYTYLYFSGEVVK